MIDILPFVSISEPCCEPRAELSDYHEEEIDDRLRNHLLLIRCIPSLFGGRFESWSEVSRCLNAESILDKHKEMCHQKRLSDEAHQQTAQSENEERVCLGTDITEHKEHGESHHTHHLLPSDAHEFIEEWRESRHSYRCAETCESDVFRLYAESAHHLAAIGGIDATHRDHRHEEYNHEDDAYRLWHPVIERVILIIFRHCPYFLTALTITIIPAARRALSSLLMFVKSILTGTRC